MSKKEKSVVGLIIGLAVLFIGWALRSTLPANEYYNKPIGGGVMALGMLVTGIFAYKLLKR
jgi:hypothetical protein